MATDANGLPEVSIRATRCPIHNVRLVDCFIAHYPEAHLDTTMTKEMTESLAAEWHEGLQNGTLKFVNGEIVPSEVEIIVLEVPVSSPSIEVVPGHGENCVCWQCSALGKIREMEGYG